MELPNNTELCKQVFLAQPRPHGIKYAKKHRVVETDMLKLQEFLRVAMTPMFIAACTLNS